MKTALELRRLERVRRADPKSFKVLEALVKDVMDAEQQEILISQRGKTGRR